jgi:hypothetical protein
MVLSPDQTVQRFVEATQAKRPWNSPGCKLSLAAFAGPPYNIYIYWSMQALGERPSDYVQAICVDSGYPAARDIVKSCIG